MGKLLGAVSVPVAGQIDNDVMYAHNINVGQGDCTLLEFSCGAVLIDAGAQNDTYASNLVAYLTAFFQDRPDLNNTLASVIITHNHEDHTHALRDIAQAFTVERLIENGQRNAAGAADVVWVIDEVAAGNMNTVVVDVDDGDIVDDTGFTSADIDPINCSGTDPVIRILSADIAVNPGWRDFEKTNNHSIVVRVDFGEASFLFTGDLEEPAIETMLDWYDGTDMLDVDVYQAGHHGSYNGTTANLVESMSPTLAVISVGPHDDQGGGTAWQYGHPRDVTVNLLEGEITRRRSRNEQVYVARAARDFRREQMRDAIYATGWDGTVKVRATADGSYRTTLH